MDVRIKLPVELTLPRIPVGAEAAGRLGQVLTGIQGDRAKTYGGEHSRRFKLKLWGELCLGAVLAAAIELPHFHSDFPGFGLTKVLSSMGSRRGSIEGLFSWEAFRTR